jgi:hypothetical protein
MKDGSGRVDTRLLSREARRLRWFGLQWEFIRLPFSSYNFIISLDICNHDELNIYLSYNLIPKSESMFYILAILIQVNEGKDVRTKLQVI